MQQGYQMWLSLAEAEQQEQVPKPQQVPFGDDDQNNNDKRKARHVALSGQRERNKERADNRLAVRSCCAGLEKSYALALAQ
jgi:hypothetical protein